MPSYVAVDRGLVYANRPAPVNGTSQIISFDPLRDRTVEVTDGSAESDLIDARDGAVLFSTRTRSGSTTRLNVFHRREGEDAVHLRDVSELGFFTFESYEGREARQVAADSAAWQAGAELWRWSSSDGPFLVEGEGAFNGQPALLGDLLAWTERGDEAATLHVHEQSTRRSRVVRTGDVDWPVLGEAASGDPLLFFVDMGRLIRLDLVTSDSTVLHPGPCGPPSAEGDRAVAACGGMARGSLVPPGAFIAYWDGVRTEALFEDGGYHFAPRISQGRIAWIRYVSADVLCTPPADRISGEVRLYDPDVSPDPITIASVGAPCLCCDAFWPAAALAFDGDVLAWNYSLDDPGVFGSIGWALIQGREVCSPN